MSKTLTTSVAFTDPQNNVLANGTIIFQLNMGAKLITNGEIVNVIKVSFTLTATGMMPASSTIIANDELMPTGTMYVVTIFNSNGLLVRGPENWILSGISPIDISTITSSSIPDPGLANPIIGNPSAPQTITGQSLTLTSSAPLNVASTATLTGALNSNNLAAGNVANKATTAQAIRFVANDGNDANDGLSWGTAKLTIAAACASIPSQDSTCLLPLGFGTIYVADTFSGSYPATFLTGGATALKIIGPGYIQADSSLVSARGAIISYANESYIGLYDGGFSYAIQAGPRGKECFPITATSVTANVLTVTCTNTFAPTETAKIYGTQETFLNGQQFTVSTASGTQWTAAFTHANYTNNSDFGLATEKFSLAANTLTLPDLSGGTSTPAPGVLLGVTATVDAAAAGHCLFYNGATAATGLSGLMNDSGIGCNTNLTFPVPARFINWTNGANTISLTAAPASGNRTATLPDASGTIAFNPPSVAGTTDLGTTALPFGNLWLGTAATNNFKFQPAATAAARVISMPDPLGAVNMPYVIANGTSTLTSNATLAAVTSQAAITTAATNTLTTDAIEWSYASAPTAGDSLCHVSAYVTAGNVNFVRTNPTAASQNVSAIVLNWRVIR